MAAAIAEGSVLLMYADLYALERSARDRRNRAEAEAANDRLLALLSARPSRLVTFLHRIGAVRRSPVQDGVQVRPSYRPVTRPIPAR